MLKVDNYIITKPILEILNVLKYDYPCGKLRDIKVKASELIVTCPNDAHNNGQEKNPDCHINLVEQDNLPVGVFNCFGCSTSGSFEKFVALYFSSSIEYAKDWLIKNFGELSSTSSIFSDDIDLTKKVNNTLDKLTLEKVYQSYCPYLQKRGISRAVAEKFSVKYDSKFRQVIFPVFDTKDNLVMLAKRSIDTKTFYMTSNVEKELYCLNYIIKNNINRLFITEGPFDCLSAWEHGVPAVATLGSVSDYQISKLNSAGINSIYLAFDNDTAGQKFNKFVKSKIKNSIFVTDIELPAGKKDLNELSDADWEDLKEKYNFN